MTAADGEGARPRRARRDEDDGGVRSAAAQEGGVAREGEGRGGAAEE